MWLPPSMRQSPKSSEAAASSLHHQSVQCHMCPCLHRPSGTYHGLESTGGLPNLLWELASVSAGPCEENILKKNWEPGIGEFWRPDKLRFLFKNKERLITRHRFLARSRSAAHVAHGFCMLLDSTKSSPKAKLSEGTIVTVGVDCGIKLIIYTLSPVLSAWFCPLSEILILWGDCNKKYLHHDAHRHIYLFNWNKSFIK